MKTVTQTLIPSTAIEVVEQMEAGNFPTKQVDNEEFFNKYPNGEFCLRKGANIQVRDEEVDLEFVERQINKRTPKKMSKENNNIFSE